MIIMTEKLEAIAQANHQILGIVLSFDDIEIRVASTEKTVLKVHVPYKTIVLNSHREQVGTQTRCHHRFQRYQYQRQCWRIRLLHR